MVTPETLNREVSEIWLLGDCNFSLQMEEDLKYLDQVSFLLEIKK